MAPHSNSLISLEDVITGARLLWRLPAFLRRPVSLDEARATLRRRLVQREADFLRLMKRAIYEYPRSPYRPLLALAGCEYGDLERLVTQDGVEGALQVLYRRGVFLTVDEFKGRRPIARGNTTIIVDTAWLRNPVSASHVPIRSSGSRGAATPVVLDLTFIRDVAVNYGLALDARGGAGWLHAIWGIPGGAVTNQLLRFSAFGSRPVRCFLQVDPAAPGLHPRYRWSARLMRWGSLLAGVPLPRPVHVPLEDPLPIARWMAEVRRTGRVPHVFAFPSSAVRLCQSAVAAGVDLRGAQLTIGGEPVTAARLVEARRAGAEAMPHFGSSETSTIGYGCLAPSAPDDLHLFHDLHVVIQPGAAGAAHGLPPAALLLSSLRATAPFILLNVSLGDQAVVGRLACGCPLEHLGWTTHLHTVRSYEKLTAGGMNFLDTDLIRVLEEVLPARFGGGPADYQVVEEETSNGQPRLRLLVHPAIGPLEAGAVEEVFLSAISRGSGVERVMGLVWQGAGFLRVERRVPELTQGGKILHLRAGGRS
ncbi:MAG: hypothetical protein HY713_14535 [candidate division NC10 bacterium]|nr:hypothetical protein [candidate division NC10 bacterium]